MVELPGRKREELSVAIAADTTSPEVIQLLLMRLHLTEEWGGALCAVVEADPTTKGTHAHTHTHTHTPAHTHAH